MFSIYIDRYHRKVLHLSTLIRWTSSLTFAGQPSGSAYLDGGTSKVDVILCHGRGHHPTWKVVDPLRKGMHEKLGYHTLSLHMPAGKKKWKAYAVDFPRARTEIEAGIAFLRDEKKVERIYLMGHSMGSRMATSYLASNPNAPIVGFVGVGIRNGGGEPLDSNANLRRVTIPIVDVYGDGGDGVDLKHAKARSDMVSDRYKQVLIPGASHTFDDHEGEVLKAVIAWLSERKLESIWPNRVAGGFYPPSPNTTRQAGPHRTVHRACRAVAGL